MLFTKEMIPASTRGRTATEPKVAISENGQIRFNGFATKKLLEGTKIPADKVSELFLDYDEKGTRKMSFSLDPTKFKAKAGDGLAAKISGKTDQLAFTATWICNQVGYDFKASGNHSFGLESKNGSHVFSFVIPEGKLENITKKRVKKVKGETVASSDAPKPATEDVE